MNQIQGHYTVLRLFEYKPVRAWDVIVVMVWRDTAGRSGVKDDKPAAQHHFSLSVPLLLFKINTHTSSESSDDMTSFHKSLSEWFYFIISFWIISQTPRRARDPHVFASDTDLLNHFTYCTIQFIWERFIKQHISAFKWNYMVLFLARLSNMSDRLLPKG